MSRVLIFSGPTLSHEHIQHMLPDAELYPPLQGGDLTRLKLEAGDLVTIIDGFFYQSSSVRHKEILELLRRGIQVWGAASMGALRAAELAHFGMRGIGHVFEAYMQGIIEGDDEVAVLHADEDMEYISFSDALVNIRHACARAVEAQLLSEAAEHRIVETAASLPFYERSYRHLLRQVPEELLSPQEAENLLSFVQQEQHNLKRQDALELLDAIQAYTVKSFVPSFEWHETSHARSWQMTEQGSAVEQDFWVADAEALTVYQLFDANYPQVHYRLLLHLLTAIAAQYFREASYEPDENSIELVARYIATRCDLDLEKEFPASVNRWVRPIERTLPRKEQLARVAVRLWIDRRSADWREALLDHLKEREMMDTQRKLVSAAHMFNQKLWGRDAAARCLTIRPERMCAWFGQRWGVTEAEFEFALLDRGFSDTTDFVERACSFYMFDKLVGVESWKQSASSLIDWRRELAS